MERGRAHQTRTGGGSGSRAEPDFLLQWGNRKRLRCVKVQVKGSAAEKATVRVDRRVVWSDKDPTALLPRPSPYRVLRNSEAMTSPPDQDKKAGSSSSSDEVAWPKFVISLTNKEKEEDFMVFKGCTKLPQRPKKRAKCVQKTLNLVCPGTWLCDLTQERYEVREKKVSKKRPRGLKAMGGVETESE